MALACSSLLPVIFNFIAFLDDTEIGDIRLLNHEFCEYVDSNRCSICFESRFERDVRDLIEFLKSGKHSLSFMKSLCRSKLPIQHDDLDSEFLNSVDVKIWELFEGLHITVRLNSVNDPHLQEWFPKIWHLRNYVKVFIYDERLFDGSFNSLARKAEQVELEFGGDSYNEDGLDGLFQNICGVENLMIIFYYNLKADKARMILPVLKYRRDRGLETYLEIGHVHLTDLQAISDLAIFVTKAEQIAIYDIPNAPECHPSDISWDLCKFLPIHLLEYSSDNFDINVLEQIELTSENTFKHIRLFSDGASSNFIWSDKTFSVLSNCEKLWLNFEVTSDDTVLDWTFLEKLKNLRELTINFPLVLIPLVHGVSVKLPLVMPLTGWWFSGIIPIRLLTPVLLCKADLFEKTHYYLLHSTTLLVRPAEWSDEQALSYVRDFFPQIEPVRIYPLNRENEFGCLETGCAFDFQFQEE